MPDEEPVVWPDDPAVEEEARAEEGAEPATASPSGWAASFDDGVKQPEGAAEPAAAAPAQPSPAAEAAAEYPTQPSMPAIPASPMPAASAAASSPTAPAVKTVPPAPATSEAAPPAGEMGDEAPTSTFKTPIPASLGHISAANGADEAPKAPEAASDQEKAEIIEDTAEPAVKAEPEPGPEPEAELEPVSAPEPIALQPEPEAEPEPEPAVAAEPEAAQEPEPQPAKAAEPEPKPPAPKQDEWVPMPVNPPVPSWAPKIGAPAVAAEKVDWPGGAPLPTWAPVAGGRSTAGMPAATRITSTPAPTPAPAPAAPASQPPAAPAAQSHPPQPAAPPAEAAKPKTSSWEIVQQKQPEQARPAYSGPSPEDRSYAEWFAWAKRSGAPAGACHAAAQGAFRALAAGHDMNTAVQWATIAMAQPPGLVSGPRQLYCAWYSLGNIDLRLPSPQAHAFAAGAIGALEAGADAPSAHQAGLAAAGITG